MEDRFFVKIVAQKRQALLGLRGFDLDLFQPTAKDLKDRGFSIEGLVTLEQVGQLVKHGYHVTVEDAADARAKSGVRPIEFDEWLEGMQDILERQRKATHEEG